MPEGIEYESVGHAIVSVPGVLELHDLHVWTMAPGHAALQGHVRVASPAEWPAVLEAVRGMLRGRFGIDHVTLQPEWASGSAD